ncbi:DUF5376 family protein [Pasteurella multocida]|uniref:DUF5376 family protein n=1 Tax=Pasteurella multocida TaxID=747 RepID=UPI003304A1B1|nr:DUF5376 family protein [Pasteurella multocida]
MKLIFKYSSDDIKFLYPVCIPQKMSEDRERDEYICIYVSYFCSRYYSQYTKNYMLEDLYNDSIKNCYIGVDAIDALIDDDNVKIGYGLYEEGCEPEDYDPEETTYVVISRKELIYLLEKWDEFLAKPIIDPHYQEIIDTKEAYL